MIYGLNLSIKKDGTISWCAFQEKRKHNKIILEETVK
jgi:hypothetical protein